QVEHVRHAVEQGAEVRIRNRLLDEPIAGPAAKGGDVGFLQFARVVIRETVERGHLRALIEEAFAQVGSDESRAACYQSLHCSSSFTRWGTRTGRPVGPSVACVVSPAATTAPSATRTTS